MTMLFIEKCVYDIWLLGLVVMRVLSSGGGIIVVVGVVEDKIKKFAYGPVRC